LGMQRNSYGRPRRVPGGQPPCGREGGCPTPRANFEWSKIKENRLKTACEGGPGGFHWPSNRKKSQGKEPINGVRVKKGNVERQRFPPEEEKKKPNKKNGLIRGDGRWTKGKTFRSKPGEVGLPEGKKQKKRRGKTPNVKQKGGRGKPKTCSLGKEKKKKRCWPKKNKEKRLETKTEPLSGLKPQRRFGRGEKYWCSLGSG